MMTSHLIGLTKEDAILHFEVNNIPFRIIREDGISFIVTRDVAPDRVNLIVDNGIVTGASLG